MAAVLLILLVVLVPAGMQVGVMCSAAYQVDDDLVSALPGLSSVIERRAWLHRARARLATSTPDALVAILSACRAHFHSHAGDLSLMAFLDAVADDTVARVATMPVPHQAALITSISDLTYVALRGSSFHTLLTVVEPNIVPHIDTFSAPMLVSLFTTFAKSRNGNGSSAFPSAFRHLSRQVQSRLSLLTADELSRVVDVCGHDLHHDDAVFVKDVVDEISRRPSEFATVDLVAVLERLATRSDVDPVDMFAASAYRLSRNVSSMSSEDLVRVAFAYASAGAGHPVMPLIARKATFDLSLVFPNIAAQTASGRSLNSLPVSALFKEIATEAIKRRRSIDSKLILRLLLAFRRTRFACDPALFDEVSNRALARWRPDELAQLAIAFSSAPMHIRYPMKRRIARAIVRRRDEIWNVEHVVHIVLATEYALSAFRTSILQAIAPALIERIPKMSASHLALIVPTYATHVHPTSNDVLRVVASYSGPSFDIIANVDDVVAALQVMTEEDVPATNLLETFTAAVIDKVADLNVHTIARILYVFALIDKPKAVSAIVVERLLPLFLNDTVLDHKLKETMTFLHLWKISLTNSDFAKIAVQCPSLLRIFARCAEVFTADADELPSSVPQRNLSTGLRSNYRCPWTGLLVPSAYVTCSANVVILSKSEAKYSARLGVPRAVHRFKYRCLMRHGWRVIAMDLQSLTALGDRQIQDMIDDVLTVPVDPEQELHDAIMRGDVAVVRQLYPLRFKFTSAAANPSWTPMHTLADSGSRNLPAMTCIMKDAINVQTWDGLTPLDIAVARSRQEAVETIRSSGGTSSDRSSKLTVTTPERMPESIAWMAAASSGDHGMFWHLLKKHRRIYPGRLNWEGDSVLHLVVQAYRLCRNVTADVAFLLSNGLPANLKNDKGRTALHVATLSGTLPGVLDLLMAHDVAINEADLKGRTAVHVAAIHGRHRFIARLFQCGADVNALDRDGRTPLHYAALNGRDRVIQELARHGGNVSALDQHGLTPYDIARDDVCKSALAALLEPIGEGAPMPTVSVPTGVPALTKASLLVASLALTAALGVVMAINTNTSRDVDAGWCCFDGGRFPLHG
ncbi:Ankyrin repeat domain-containing protein [Plasmodiophora brassicae]